MNKHHKYIFNLPTGEMGAVLHFLPAYLSFFLGKAEGVPMTRGL